MSTKNSDDVASSFETCVRAELKRIEYCASGLFTDLSLDSIHSYNECYKSFSRGSANCQSGNFDEICPTLKCGQATVKNSFYVSQIYEWKLFFGNNLMVINSNDFYANPADYMEIIGDFIGLEPYNWTSVTSHAFNIVNPTVNKNVNVITDVKGLGIGESDHGNEYPTLNEEVRKEFEITFSKLNSLLATVLNKPKFWNY